jgi:hypothetical protein
MDFGFRSPFVPVIKSNSPISSPSDSLYDFAALILLELPSKSAYNPNGILLLPMLRLTLWPIALFQFKL